MGKEKRTVKLKSKAKKTRHINNLAEFYRHKVRDIMDRRFWDLPIVSRDDDIIHVIAILRSQYHVWIVNNLKDREVCGVITEHDILNLLAPRGSTSHLFSLSDVNRWKGRTTSTIGGLMCSRVVTAEPGDTIQSVLLKMKKYSIRRLPVTKNRKLVGEVTLHTLLNKYYDIISQE